MTQQSPSGLGFMFSVQQQRQMAFAVELLLLTALSLTLLWMLPASMVVWCYWVVGISVVLFLFWAFLHNHRQWGSIATSLYLAVLFGLVINSLIASVCLLTIIIAHVFKFQVKYIALVSIMSMVLALLSSTMIATELQQHVASQPYLEITTLVLMCIWLLYYQWQYQLIVKGFATQRLHSQDRISTMVSVINKLTRFIPRQVWQPIVKDNQLIRVTNKRVKLTILFADIVGFTELSDTLSSDQLADILNTYMDRMTVIAQRHGAVMDKFIGDGMVCFFGDPHSKGQKEDALACVAMAMDMRREMQLLRHQWRLQGFEGLYLRFGINTGYCHVGNFGSDNRMSYTLIGREANLASRLESAAKEEQILISQSSYELVRHDYECEMMAELKLKGFDAPISCWQVISAHSTASKPSDWVYYDLPGFNLHLNFQNIRNYDYRHIQRHLMQAMQQIKQKKPNQDSD